MNSRGNDMPNRETDTRHPTESPGAISVMEIYTLNEARQRLGWTDSSLRAAKRRGLPMLSCGKRKYVAGRDVLRFLRGK
jgi:hypothetical protein